MSNHPTDPERLCRSRYRQMLASIPGARSCWHLARALKDAWFDSSERAKVALQQDFSRKDPWDYTTDELEILRHSREAKMLDAIRGSSRFGKALEVGCAEGVFTELLAKRCDSLLATDISEIALGRARQRRQWGKHVAFAPLDLRVDPLPNVFDLILAVHVLEYIQNPLSLRKVRERLVRGLRAGGYLLIGSISHNDIREKAWWSRYLLHGGQQINAFMASHHDLNIVDSAICQVAPGSTSCEILLQRSA
jgi:SAM-dependent methyltransferase